MPGGDAAGVAKTPPCPGHPWVRHDGPRQLWWSAADSQHRIEVSHLLVLQFGRGHVEELVARRGFPPLPEDAWKDLLLPLAHSEP